MFKYFTLKTAKKNFPVFRTENFFRKVINHDILNTKHRWSNNNNVDLFHKKESYFRKSIEIPYLYDLLESKHKDHIFFLFKWHLLLHKRRVSLLLDENDVLNHNKTSFNLIYGITNSVSSIILSSLDVSSHRKPNIKLSFNLFNLVNTLNSYANSLFIGSILYSGVSSFKKVFLKKYRVLNWFIKERKRKISIGSMYLRSIKNNLFVTFVIDNKIIYTVSFKDVTRRVFKKKTRRKKKLYYFFGHVFKSNRYVLKKYNLEYITVYFSCKPNVISKVCRNLRNNKAGKRKVALRLRKKLINWYDKSPLSCKLRNNKKKKIVKYKSSKRKRLNKKRRSLRKRRVVYKLRRKKKNLFIKKKTWLLSELLKKKHNKKYRKYIRLRKLYFKKRKHLMVNHVYINVFTKAYNGSKNKKNYRYA